VIMFIMFMPAIMAQTGNEQPALTDDTILNDRVAALEKRMKSLQRWLQSFQSWGTDHINTHRRTDSADSDLMKSITDRADNLLTIMERVYVKPCSCQCGQTTGITLSSTINHPANFSAASNTPTSTMKRCRSDPTELDISTL